MRSLSPATPAQRNSTSVRDSQREMPFFATAKAPVEVDNSLVESCKDELMAVNRCMDLSGLADEALADALGIDKGHFSRIRRGRGHFPTRKRLQLMYLCGNMLPAQFEALKLRRKLAPMAKDEQIALLERALEEARRAA
jgi:hypothetical protein